MNLTFYYAPMSTASVTALVIEELGLSPKVVKMDLKAGDTKKPEFLKLNPNGMVPVIVHDDVPIFESAAITMYLGETFGVAKGLYPAPGPKRAEVMKWLTWTHVTLGEAVYRWARNTQGWVPPAEASATAGESGRVDMQKYLTIFDKNLQGRKFITGNDYTIVDGHMNSMMDWMRHMKADFSACANINEWSKRIGERPAYKKVVAAEMG